MNTTDLEKRLAACESLPVLPVALQNVQKLMGDPKSTMAQIAGVIATDQALTSKTIKLVNSAFYGMSRPVSSITQAIIILGLSSLNHLMLGLSVTKLFSSGKTILDHNAFWLHAFGVALISKGMAETTHLNDPEQCFIAGLMHDIGRLVLEQKFHDDYSKALAIVRKRKSSLIKAETEVFGADHAFAGRYIADKWKIPPVFSAAMQYHHALQAIPPEYGEYAPVIRIVAAANVMAVKENIGDSGERDMMSFPFFVPHEISAQTISSIITNAKSTISSTLQQWGIHNSV